MVFVNGVKNLRLVFIVMRVSIPLEDDWMYQMEDVRMVDVVRHGNVPLEGHYLGLFVG